MARAASRRNFERSNDFGASLAPAQKVDAIRSQIRDGKVGAIQPGHLVSMGPS